MALSTNTSSNANVLSDTVATTRGYRTLALAVLTCALVGLCIVLSIPFYPAVAWGVALAVIAWPLQAWIVRRLPYEIAAATVTTTLVVLMIVGPAVFVSYHMAEESAKAAERIRDQSSETAVREKVAETPALAGAVEWMDRVGINLDREIHKAIEANSKDVSALASGSIMAIVQFGITVFILFFLLLDRQKLLGQVRDFLPMTREESDRVVRSAADSIHANLLANLITSCLASVGGGVMFWLLGLPSPVTWAVVIFVISLLPLLGIWLIWVPAGLYLAISGQWTQAAFLFAWGVANSILVDNVLYMQIAGRRMRLHQVPTLLAILGGIAIFGVSGMIIGPVIVAVTVAVLDVWHRRATGTGDVPDLGPALTNGRAAANV